MEALRSINVDFGSFDILSDEAIRQGLKEYSNWPTYPQLYVKGVRCTLRLKTTQISLSLVTQPDAVSGELVGGCDIVLEMQASGELKSAIDEMLYRMAE